jgi:hypothetical protein
MNLVEKVKAAFQGFPFEAPATIEDLRQAESKLGEPLPAVLRNLYLGFNGFRGPTNARFLWPLFGKDSLVEFNAFLRCGDEFPREFVHSCIFFGDEGIGPMWGIKQDIPGTIIRWDAEWGEDFEVVGATPLEVWLRSKHSFDSISDAPIA